MVHLSAADIACQKAHVSNDRSKNIVISHANCMMLAAVAIIFRIASRQIEKVKIRCDNNMIIAAAVFVVGEIVRGL